MQMLAVRAVQGDSEVAYDTFHHNGPKGHLFYLDQLYVLVEDCSNGGFPLVSTRDYLWNNYFGGGFH